MSEPVGILILVTLFVLFGWIARERRGGGCACTAAERERCGSSCSLHTATAEDDRARIP